MSIDPPSYHLKHAPRDKWPRRFVTTRWRMIRAAAEGDTSEAQAARDELYRTYWYPVYARMRTQFDAEVAAELTQTVFLSMLARHELRTVDPAHGRFRSWLTAASHSVMKNHHRYEQAKMRDQRITVAFDVAAAERRYQADVAHGNHPEQQYQHNFSLCFLERCTRLLEAKYAGANPALFQALLSTMRGQQPGDDYRGIAAALNMTAEATRQAASRMRARYQEIIKKELLELVAHPDDAEAELVEIYEALRNRAQLDPSDASHQAELASDDDAASAADSESDADAEGEGDDAD